MFFAEILGVPSNSILSNPNLFRKHLLFQGNFMFFAEILGVPSNSILSNPNLFRKHLVS